MTRMTEMTATNKIEPFLFQNALYEGGNFDFTTVGTKWLEGCYCLPDRALGKIMERWSSNYEYVIVDSPAGREHLNHRITKEVDDIFNILDPSKKSFDNAMRAYRVVNEVGIKYKNYYLVGGYRFHGKLEDEAMKQPFPYLGRIEYDELVDEYNLEGKSLLELPDDSLAYLSFKGIMNKTEYEKKQIPLSDLLSLTWEVNTGV
jgi:CO dehydrogenase maturation factor